MLARGIVDDGGRLLQRPVVSFVVHGQRVYLGIGKILGALDERSIDDDAFAIAIARIRAACG